MRCAIVLLVVSVLGLAQDKPPTPAPPKERPAPKNLKVLKATTGEEVSQIMRTFTIGLGVQCNFCHIQGNFASDENPKKDIARRMITMTHDVNSLFPGDEKKMRVSCYTCHRGEAEPKTAPVAAAPQ
jgi:Photosynthetic reaction centre cytochrome C subunit